MKQLITKPQFIVLTVVSIIIFILAWWLLSSPSDSNNDFDDRNAHYSGPFKLHVVVDPVKPKVGNNELTITVYDKNNQPVTDAQIKAVAEMAAMGSMPAMPAQATMGHNGAGEYQGVFEILMAGAWPLSLEINSRTTGNARLQFDLTTSRTGLRLSSATDALFSPDTSSSSMSDSNMNSDNSGNKIIKAGLYSIEVNINPNPPIVGKNNVTIIVNDKSGQAVTGATVRAVAQMPAMGSKVAMNSPAEISETTPGVYSGKLELFMQGEWPLAIDIESEKLGHGDLIFNLTTGQKGLKLSSATPGDISHYTCSMHPSVKSTTPGTCPICAMNLLPETKKELQSGSISMDARRRQLIGVTTDKVEFKELVQTIRAAGRISYNQTQLTDVALKFNGWIGKLHSDFVGASVIKGNPLFTVYSPELLSAQQEYLETLHRNKGKHSSLLRAARLRLSLWDISSSQIMQLEKRNSPIEYLAIMSPVNGIVIEKTIVSGSAIKVGQKLLRIADLSSVWVEGDIYEYEIPLVKVGMAARVVLPELSDKSYNGKISYISPYLEGDTRTATVRLALDNNDGVLKPNMYAHLHIEVDLGKRLVVPESAVLYAGTSRVVFLDLGNGQLQPRKIKTGLRNADDIEVLEGLDPGDIVVSSGNFLIAAESKLKAGIDQW